MLIWEFVLNFDWCLYYVGYCLVWFVGLLVCCFVCLSRLLALFVLLIVVWLVGYLLMICLIVCDSACISWFVYFLFGLFICGLWCLLSVFNWVGCGVFLYVGYVRLLVFKRWLSLFVVLDLLSNDLVYLIWLLIYCVLIVLLDSVLVLRFCVCVYFIVYLVVVVDTCWCERVCLVFGFCLLLV